MKNYQPNIDGWIIVQDRRNGTRYFWGTEECWTPHRREAKEWATQESMPKKLTDKRHPNGGYAFYFVGGMEGNKVYHDR